MSFSSDVFHKKLIVLQDTQESIVSISQWVLFHHRHSDIIAKVWSQYLLNSSDISLCKRLSMLHMCNDVVQRARRKGKPEFITQFATVLPQVLNYIYALVDNPIQTKIDRLIVVWEERAVFESQDIAKMKNAIQTSSIIHSDPTVVAKDSVGSKQENSTEFLGSTVIAPSLILLNSLYTRYNELERNSQANLLQLGNQSRTYLPNDSDTSDFLPVPKVYIAKLNMLEKLSQVSIANILELQSIRQHIADRLNSLARTILDRNDADKKKVEIINQRLHKLESKKSELKKMFPNLQSNEEAISSGTITINTIHHDSEDDSIPTYEDDEENKDNENSDHTEISNQEPKNENYATHNAMPASLKRVAPDNDQPMLAKRVAFSDNIQIKEFSDESDIYPPIGTSYAQITSTDDSYVHSGVLGYDGTGKNAIADHLSREYRGESGDTDIMDLLSKL